jgi:hypothetical protein
MTRHGFTLTPAKGGVILRISQRAGHSQPQGYPFLLTPDELRLLLTLLAGHLAEFVHEPGGCEDDRCPCREKKQKALAEQACRVYGEAFEEMRRRG